MKKSVRIFAFLLVCVMSMALLSIGTNAASVYDRQKKSIYFVMDDSGSMGDGKSEYDANYSLQALLAMTDKGDDVHLYFLNNNSRLSGDMNMSQKSNQMIENVKLNYPLSTGGTPYSTVESAKKELTNAAHSGDQTEYWLVVLTDGGFDEGVAALEDVYKFAEETLANGTHPNVMFISIGQKNVFTGTFPSNFYYIEGNDIIESMNEAAATISGRVEITDESYSADNKEITFTTQYPAKNIIVFTQNRKTTVTDATSATGAALEYSENYTVSYPVANSNLTDSTVCFITAKDGSSIPAGEIKLVFDTALVQKDTTVLVEPAIGLVAHYYNQDGQEIDPGNLRVGEKARVEFSLCDSETQQPLDPSAFGGSVTYSATIDGQTTNSNNVDFEVGTDKIDIALSATLPDGYVLDIRNEYKDLDIMRTVSFSLSNGGMFEADYDKIKDAEPLTGTVLLNGKQPTEEEMKDFTVKVKGVNPFTSNVEIKKDDATGTFTIIPKKGWISPLTPESKTYEVVLLDKQGDEKTVTLTVDIPGERPWIPLLIWSLALLAAGFLIWYVWYVLYTKTYFPRGVEFAYYPNNPPIDMVTHSKAQYTFGDLYKLEWKHSKKTFWKHFFEQFKPHTAMKVTLFGIGAKGTGQFAKITLIASSPNALSVKDTSLKRDEDGNYTCDHDLYESDFIESLDINENMKSTRTDAGYRLGINKIIAKKIKDAEGYTYTHYLHFRKKKARRGKRAKRNRKK